ncbi:MAG: sugar phosphate isomerase/epimerase family protein [Promethearchaeota archaeon]|jgi:sugar phosphate isomerase/epimerase
MELGLGSIAFIYDSINNGKFENSKDLLLYSIEKTFNFAENNDIRVCELIIDPPEILLGDEKKTFIDLCNSYPSIIKQFHAPYAYLSLSTYNPWILEASIDCYSYSAKICAEIGAQVYTIHPGNAKFLHQSYNRVKNRLVDAVNTLLNKIKDFNIITCIENMPKMAGFFLNYEEIEEFYLQINRSDVFFTWDTGHSWSCHDEIENLWERLHKKIKNIHLVEETGNSKDLHPTIGVGSVDFPKVFEIAERYNYGGALIMELHKVEDLPQSIDYIKKLY